MSTPEPQTSDERSEYVRRAIEAILMAMNPSTMDDSETS